jgi:hypothetical protein
MRDIAEFVRDRRPDGNYILVELVAAQVVAKLPMREHGLRAWTRSGEPFLK